MALNGAEISLFATSTGAALDGSELNCSRCWTAAPSVLRQNVAVSKWDM